MYKKLSDTIEGVYFSAYLEFQTSISFFLSATESQSWFHNAQPCYNFELFSHFYYSITQNIFERCIYETSRNYRGDVCSMLFPVSNRTPKLGSQHTKNVLKVIWYMCGGLQEAALCRDSKSREKAISLSNCHFLCNFGFHHF